MGWTGGKVGKNNRADVPPLPPLVGCRDRAGLGFSQSVAFRPAVRNIIAKFVQLGGDVELVFSPELTSEERDVVRSEAWNNHLQFRCHQREPAVEDIYAVVSIQRSPMELVNYLQKHGGENHKYRLLEPCEVQF